MDIDANDVSVSSHTQAEEPTGEMLNLLQYIQESQLLDIPESDQEHSNETQNAVESESSLASDSDMKNHNEIQIEQHTFHLECTPCIQYEHDVDLDCDVTSGWVRLEQDTGPPTIHGFQGVCKTYLDINMQTAMPGEYFDQFFKTKCGLSSVKT